MQTSYIKTKLNNIINITEIITIHYYEFDKTFTFSGEKHNFWEMVYVDKGMVEIKSDNSDIILKQGEIIFHKPNEFHSIKSYNSAPNIFVISFVCKSLSMTYLEGYKTQINEQLKPFITSILHEANNAYVIPKNDIRLKKLQPKQPTKIGSEQLIKSYLEQFLILLIRGLTEKNSLTLFPAKENMENYLVSEIKKYIKSNLYKKITINEICKKFGYSKSYLSQLFNLQSSNSLIKYYKNCQIEEAKKLIREGRFTITEVSDKLAFDNPQYFSRTFKKYTGLTPSEFKKSVYVK